MRTRLALGFGALAITLAACGGGESASDSTGGTATIDVTAPGGFKYDKDAYTIPAGPQKIGLINKDAQAHNIVIDGPNGQIKFAAGSKSNTIGDVDLPAGEYRMYCNLPGHEAGGMVASLTVG
jgi:plastocyanin